MTFTEIPIWAIGLGIVVLVIGASFAGYQIARWRNWGENPGIGYTEAAAFALVGLLLGFSFSLALNRFDQRRAITVTEANAIGTTYLRCDLLDPKLAAQLRADLRSYLQVRIEFVSGGTLESRRGDAAAMTEALQTQMWSLAANAVRQDPRSTALPLFVQSLNNAIDVSSQQAAALRATIPGAVIAVLVLVTLIAAGLLGCSYAKGEAVHLIPTTMFALVLALVIALILDLDRPRRGFIQVSLYPLTSLQDTMTAHDKDK